jgi:hypothetical protein
MDELSQFWQPHPAGGITKYEKQGLDEVRLTRAVGSDNAAKAMVEGPYCLFVGVGFEIV